MCYCNVPYIPDMIFTLKYYWGDQIKKNEMGMACVMHWEEKLLQGFGWKIWKKQLVRSECRW